MLSENDWFYKDNYIGKHVKRIIPDNYTRNSNGIFYVAYRHYNTPQIDYWLRPEKVDKIKEIKRKIKYLISL